MKVCAMRVRVFLILSLALCAATFAASSNGSAQGAIPLCEDACYDAEGECFESCDRASDADACHADCAEQANACLDACE